MRIVSSAIKFRETPHSQYWHIICGKRHCDCFETMFNHQFTHDRNSEVQGFLTDTNQFVDRYEAAEIDGAGARRRYDRMRHRRHGKGKGGHPQWLT